VGRRFLALTALGFVLAACSALAPRERRRPNVVVILADDLGYGDVHAYDPASRIPTPNLDRLATQGLRFTDAHTASAVCSPSRYALLTGRYCWRTWLKSGVLFPPEDRPLIEPDRPTLASLLGGAGYRTAVIGKWHVGLEWGRDAEGELDLDARLGYGPRDVGFDESLILAGSLDMIPFVLYRDHVPTAEVSEQQEGLRFPRFLRAGPRARDFEVQGVLDRLTEEAVAFVERAATADQPFFLYLPLTAPHKPVWPAERFVGSTGLGPYGDFVHQVDWSVGQVLAALDRARVTEDTLVVFTSDNGSYMFRRDPEAADHVDDETIQGYRPERHRPNGPWRGTKADIWEAGHRVPFLVRWPGRIAAGTTTEESIGVVDLLATIADATGCAVPDGAAEDSVSLLPLLTGGEWRGRGTPLVHHSVQGMFALRDGVWKLVLGNGSGGREKPAGKPFERPYALFDLGNDPGETDSVIEAHADVAERMAAELDALRRAGGPADL
jgi:arylsulfatase A